jgi:uroporphyrinogen decarboxylase
MSAPARARERMLAALRGERGPGGHPVWLMRQAGRYLPEYRALRAANSFLELVHSPALCTEAALQPLRRYDLDATIVFSDILVLPDALGMGLSFAPGDGPSFARPVRSAADVAALAWDGLGERMDFVYQAVAQLRVAAPEKAVIGFAGAPWTLYCYMVDGEGGEFPEALASVRQDPGRARALLDRLADAVADHLLAQVRAGADCVQLFDTWSGRLGADYYVELCRPGMRRIAERLAAAGVPSIAFLRGADALALRLDGAPFSCVSVDAATDLARLRRDFPGRCTQGNVASEVLLGVPAAIADAVRAVHIATGGAENHIYNLGHGVLPSTPPAAVSTFVEAVRGLS